MSGNDGIRIRLWHCLAGCGVLFLLTLLLLSPFAEHVNGSLTWQPLDVVSASFAQTSAERARTGRLPPSWRDLAPLKDYVEPGGKVVHIGSGFFVVEYDRRSFTDASELWCPVIALHRVKASGKPFLLWQESYGVAADGSLAMFRGYLPPIRLVCLTVVLVAAIVALPIIAFRRGWAQ
jgi:hypothetical protein